MGLKKTGGGLGLWVLLGLLCSASAQTSWRPVQKIMGRAGMAQGDGWELLWPRKDINVLVQGTPLEPGLVLTSWFFFQPLGSNTLLRGRLVLLDSEVGKVLAQLEDQNFKVTALGSPLLSESPKIRTVYFEGQGRETELAKSLQWILTVTGLGNGDIPQPSPTPVVRDWSAIEKILGLGEKEGPLLSYEFFRNEPILEDGTPVSPSRGTATSIFFQKAGGQIAAAGSFALKAAEVPAVMGLLRAHHIQVTAVENHWIGEAPRLFFVQFWAQGGPEEIAEGFRAALDEAGLRNLGGKNIRPTRSPAP
jgi:hypothetical protein